ncbi:hypothetical protein BKA62DRAFT_234025 [Auriculariales sp. MPI-PUGE-AT-0066]|nr:hypothetical protein BKA62DRAFT_234025 [Auriculariales sp. MPI-PUGE-AT-0066]
MMLQIDSGGGAADQNNLPTLPNVSRDKSQAGLRTLHGDGCGRGTRCGRLLRPVSAKSAEATPARAAARGIKRSAHSALHSISSLSFLPSSSLVHARRNCSTAFATTARLVCAGRRALVSYFPTRPNQFGLWLWLWLGAGQTLDGRLQLLLRSVCETSGETSPVQVQRQPPPSRGERPISTSPTSARTVFTMPVSRSVSLFFAAESWDIARVLCQHGLSGIVRGPAQSAMRSHSPLDPCSASASRQPSASGALFPYIARARPPVIAITATSHVYTFLAPLVATLLS